MVTVRLYLMENGANICLKEEVIGVLNDENQNYYKSRANELIPFTTKELFNIDCSYTDLKLERCEIPQNWLDMPQDQLIYEEFTLDAERLACEHEEVTALVECKQCEEFEPCRRCHCGEHCFEFSGEIICYRCKEQQELQDECIKCGQKFPTRCGICGIILAQEKPIFHCSLCDSCVVGYRENYQHCQRCNMCVHSCYFSIHVCFSDKLCSVCLNPLRDYPIVQMKCGHVLHGHCFEKVVFTLDECPLCRRTAAFGSSEALLKRAKSQLYEEYVGLSRLWNILRVRCELCRREFYHRDRNALYCAKCDYYQVIELESLGNGEKEEEMYLGQETIREPRQIQAALIKAKIQQVFSASNYGILHRDAMAEFLAQHGVHNDNELIEKNEIISEELKQIEPDATK